MATFKILFFEDEVAPYVAPYVEALADMDIESRLVATVDDAYQAATTQHDEFDGLVVDSIAPVGQSQLIPASSTDHGLRTGIRLLQLIQEWERKAGRGPLPAFVLTNRTDEDVAEGCRVRGVFLKLFTLPLDFSGRVKNDLAAEREKRRGRSA